MGYFLDYENYFRQKWQSFSETQYDSETNDNFHHIDIEEALGDFRTKLKGEGYAMALITYTSQRADSRTNPEILREAGFYVMHYHGNEDNDYREAMDNAEELGWKMADSLIEDSLDGDTFLNYSFSGEDNEFRAIPSIRSVSGNYSGWMFLFTLRAFAPTCD